MQNHHFSYSRFKTRIVDIGDIPLGGDYPIRIQSMTNTNTLDTKATVKQIISLAEEGCEYVRITIPTLKEAENIKEIKKELKKRGFKIPLIADVHFNPAVAEYVAPLVEKVRINPGNYSDKKNFKKLNFSDAEYLNELERIKKRFLPLVKICKEYGTAMRIGTNHGSLSDRIIGRYGDTIEGMTESAMEFIRICRDFNFLNIVVSMKSSNPLVMVHANKLMAERMIHEKMSYPVHLGVTEAGDGENGIIKSSVGIGTLLEEGIGDTIRVSLTGNPEQEIPVAKTIAERYNSRFEKDKKFFTKFSGPENKLARTRTNIDFPVISNNKNNVLNKKSALVLEASAENKVNEIREEILKTGKQKNKLPLIAKLNYSCSSKMQIQVFSSIDFGYLLLNNLIDGLWLDTKNKFSSKFIDNILFSILQSTGKKITKTEYISCPTCGRTTYNVLETTKKIRAKTKHLKGLKIAVMGCIVNGLGEMADADYGYIGTANGKVNLYKQNKLLKKNIEPKVAVECLVELIKENGDWVEN
ncbi:MAG: (E)-4-hydroxy-3-methylbut-2-enyl-diphosphate synthase [Bacteroidales bacterium]|nr:(E)-4-hydroxy-3-methylbut-2-enyl-diphosphate synthase [Bacteroidales bacterium]